jgi:lipopolysaccharide transport system ATP-binding protein
VAAHLEPEILIVDEVLAVGDAAFQKKCLGKMKDVGREGRTILFVSHNMAAIKALCTKCALLENGFLKATGETHSIVSEYFNATMDFNTNKDLSDRVDRVGGKKISCIHFDILNLDKDSMKDVCCGMPISIEFIFESKVAHLENLRFGLYFCYKETGELLTELNTYYNSKKIYSCQKGSYKIKFSWPKLPLSPGTYIINIIITSGLEVLDWVRDAGQLNVVEGSYYDSGLMPLPGNYPVFFSDFDFSLIQNND